MPLDATVENPFAQFNTPNSIILFPVGERRVGWETRSGAYQRVNSHKAIVRMTQDGNSVHVLSVVGNGYRLVHNRELFTRVEDTMCKVIPAHHLQDVRVTDRVSGFGRMCYRDYVFPSIKCVVGNQSKSTVAFRMIVQNGYGGSALRMHLGAIDFYCSNGMIQGDYTNTYHKHTSGVSIDGIDSIMSDALDVFAISQAKWHKWTETPVRHSAAMQLFRDLAQSNKLQENLADQYTREAEERGATLWSVYSTLTFYASHNEGAFTLRSTVEQQDTVASTMLQRELNVAAWMKSAAWKKLEESTL